MIIIKEVVTKKDLKKFAQFPIKLYKGCEYFVPQLIADEMSNFDPKQNAAYEFCETKLFLAYKDNKIVGRVAGLINHAYIEKMNQNIMRFTRYDVIDDLEVSKALIDKVKAWGKENKMEKLIGPIGFIDIDPQGLLVDGFKEMNLSITLYNHEYYKVHLEALGFKKDIDWVEYQITVPDKVDPRIERVSEMVQRRYGFYRFKPTRKELLVLAKEAFDVINESFAKLYGTVPLTEKIIDQAIKSHISLVPLDFVIAILNKEDKLIGFGLLVPSLAAAVKKSNGKLFPLGIFRMLKAIKKYSILEMYFIAVKPEFQNMGVNAVIMSETIKEAINHKVLFAETGPELENNSAVQDQWKDFDARQHRRRRCYITNI